jgi:hypothetical protein
VLHKELTLLVLQTREVLQQQHTAQQQAQHIVSTLKLVMVVGQAPNARVDETTREFHQQPSAYT